MSSYGVFEVDLFIKGKKFTHPVNVIKELNENIIGIDFIHAHKLTYEYSLAKGNLPQLEQTLSQLLRTQCYQQ